MVFDSDSLKELEMLLKAKVSMLAFSDHRKANEARINVGIAFLAINCAAIFILVSTTARMTKITTPAQITSNVQSTCA
jgi:hypothetical protein